MSEPKDSGGAPKQAKRIVRVGDVMTPDVITIARDATVREAAERMRRQGTSSVVVERRDDDDEYGLLAVTDIAEKVIARNLSPDRVDVYEVMVKPVLSLPKDMNVVFAVRMLSRFQLTRALVIDDMRTPVGIVTLRDMVLRQLDED